MNRKHFIVIFFLVAGIVACDKDNLDAIFPGFHKPGNFPEPTYHFTTNPVTQDGFELGKKLFYDPVLSVNNTISCGSCHIQSSGFTQHGHSVSHGIFDRIGTRNSQPIMNLAWSPSFMWDGGVFDLDLQPIAPITNHVEMGESVSSVLGKLKKSTVYPPLFKKAFGTTDITTASFLKALSQFMVMCVSNNAKYDSVKRNQSVFSDDERAGYSVYQQKCSSCHTEPLFTGHSFRNNGLSISLINDMGRYAVTLQNSDKYTFKTPSLRNLAFTPPYMHDGRFFTLDAVLDHYTSQVQATPNLDPILQNGSQLGIELTTVERQQLLTFLKTLNDKTFVTDKRFAE
ncbi:cytochrome-c peroxidase [Ferruginibacter sp. SUN002]|uniref:cytochrome-c peroxidase n=1 Tax=Ferruginibacter sp. SUN002 TaxID=2937789 RepID=UPI003D35EF59